MNDQTLTAYILAGAISLGFLLISAIIANVIKYEGGSNPQDQKKRRIWFWVLAILCPVVTFAIGFFSIRSGIKVPTMQAKFTTALSIGTGCGFVLYILLGFILSKIFKNGKIGHWF